MAQTDDPNNPNPYADPNQGGTNPSTNPFGSGGTPGAFTSVAGAPSADQVAGWYNQYLGRSASPDEVKGWLTGAYSGNAPSTWENQIATSGEAQAYKSKQSGSPAPAPSPSPNGTGPQAALSGFSQYGGSITQDQVNQLGQQYGLGDGLLYNDSRGTTVGFPTGYFAWGPNGWTWNVRGPEGASAPAPTPSGPPPAGGPQAGPGGGSGNSATSAAGNAVNANYQPLIDQLMARANQSLNIDPNDPIIKNQVDAFSNTQTKQMRDYLSQLAESGGPNSNIGSETRLANENVGQNTSAMQATLMSNELTARRTEVQNALSEVGSLLSTDQQLALQKELGYLNDALSRYGINTNAGLQQQTINSNNDQFLQTLGLQTSNQNNYWDAVRTGLL